MRLKRFTGLKAVLIFFALTAAAGTVVDVNAAGVIPEMDLITAYSSTGGNTQFKNNNQDLTYKAAPGDVLAFSITPASIPETLNYLWQVRQGSQVLASATQGTTYNWTIPSLTSTWEIEVEATIKDGAGNTKGRKSISWSITTADLKTVNPGESIQAALDSLPAGGGVVALAAGNHSISSPITITKTNVTLKGSGRDNTVITVTVPGRAVIMINKYSWRPFPPYNEQNLHNSPWQPGPNINMHFAIQDLKLYGYDISLMYGIDSEEASFINISNVWIEHTWRPILISGSKAESDPWVNTIIDHITIKNHACPVIS